MSYNPDVLHTEDFMKEAMLMGALERQLHHASVLLDVLSRLVQANFPISLDLPVDVDCHWRHVAGEIGAIWEAEGPWCAELEQRDSALRAIEHSESQNLIPQYFDELAAAMDTLDRYAAALFLASEKRYLATDRAEEWAADFDDVRATLAEAREYVNDYHAQWLAAKEGKK